MDITLNSGNNNNGSSEVTEIETASVIHQTTIHNATAITVSALSEMASVGNTCIIINNSGPRNRPIRFESG